MVVEVISRMYYIQWKQAVAALETAIGHSVGGPVNPETGIRTMNPVKAVTPNNGSSFFLTIPQVGTQWYVETRILTVTKTEIASFFNSTTGGNPSITANNIVGFGIFDSERFFITVT